MKQTLMNSTGFQDSTKFHLVYIYSGLIKGVGYLEKYCNRKVNVLILPISQHFPMKPPFCINHKYVLENRMGKHHPKIEILQKHPFIGAFHVFTLLIEQTIKKPCKHGNILFIWRVQNFGYPMILIFVSIKFWKFDRNWSIDVKDRKKMFIAWKHLYIEAVIYIAYCMFNSHQYFRYFDFFGRRVHLFHLKFVNISSLSLHKSR